MKSLYTIAGFMKLVEQDDYEHGCIDRGGFTADVDLTFSAETTDKLVEDICSFFDVDRDSVELNACEEPGRIDIAKTETAEGYTPTDHELEQWKEGKLKLYYAVYVGQLTTVSDASF